MIGILLYDGQIAPRKRMSEEEKTPESEEFKKQLQALKPKKKMSVSKDLLEGANSYDSKLLAIKMVADRELLKTVKLFKDMLKEDHIHTKKEPEPPPPPVAPPKPKRKFFNRDQAHNEGLS